MTAKSTPLTDGAIRRALRELAAGPDGAVVAAGVLREIETTPQVRTLWRLPDRRVALVAVPALLAAALVGGLLAASGMLPPQRVITPAGPPTLVVQSWNGLVDPESIITHTAFLPGAGGGTVVEGLPRNAAAVRWAPDGSRLSYFSMEAALNLPGLGGPRPRMRAVALFLADPDGSDHVQLELRRPFDQYLHNGFWTGPLWAPVGRHVAVPWYSGDCSGPNCIPPTGVDLFDRDGRLIDSVATPGNLDGSVIWSPDGRSIGWHSATCANDQCQTTAFHWWPIDGASAVTTIEMESGWVVWPDDGRLRVASLDGNPVANALTMRPDGSDVRPVEWQVGPEEVGIGWSPDGGWLAAYTDDGRVRVRDVAAGTERTFQTTPGLSFAAWAPDGSAMVFFSYVEGLYAFTMVGVDEAWTQFVGEGSDFGWMPRSLLP